MVPIDLHICDPLRARFIPVKDDQTGKVYQMLAQEQGFGRSPKILNTETVFYGALDALPEQRLGTPMIDPALYASITLLAIVQDMRKVIAHQGYPRYHYRVDVDELRKLIEALHPNLIGNDALIAEFIKTHQNTIRTQLESLEPTSDFIGLSTVDIAVAGDGKGSFNIQGIEGYLRLIERQVVRGVKSTRF